MSRTHCEYDRGSNLRNSAFLRKPHEKLIRTTISLTDTSLRTIRFNTSHIFLSPHVPPVTTCSVRSRFPVHIFRSLSPFIPFAWLAYCSTAAKFVLDGTGGS
jgi:hypothetical protein